MESPEGKRELAKKVEELHHTVGRPFTAEELARVYGGSTPTG